MHFTAPILPLIALGALVTGFVQNPWAGGERSARAELAKRGVAFGPEAFFEAIEKEDRATSRLLLRGGMDPDERDERGRTLLMLAVENEMPDLAEVLIEKGANLHAVDRNGAAVLEYAVRAGEISIVAALLDRGINADLTIAGGGSLVAEAVKEGRIASAKLLLESGASKWGKCSEDGPMIFHAARRGADWLVSRLLDGGVTATVSDGKGDSLMHTAVRGRRAHLLQLFGKHGIDPNVRDGEGMTALHLAVLDGQTEMLPILLEQGASAGSMHPTGWTPLHLAMQRGDFAAVRTLLAHGASPNARGAHGRTTMDLVVALESPPEQLKLLLEAGVEPNHAGPDGRTAFDVILDRRDFVSAQLLLDHDAAAGSAMQNAVVEGDEETFTFLLENKVDPNGRAKDAPLVEAVRSGRVSMVTRLLAAGASTERKGKCGQAALHVALAMNRVDLAEALLQAGADVNVPFADPVSPAFLAVVRKIGYMHWQFKSDRRMTPLMMAADSGNHAMTRLLLEHGARRDVWTKKKAYYPIGFAARRSDVKMMQLLLGCDPENEARWIKVDLSDQRAYVYGKGGKMIFATRISSGKEGFRTKTGEFVITNKTKDHVSTLYEDAEMPYFQRLSCGDFGFHEGYCPGNAASHGCLRVPKGNAYKLWKLTQPGDRVVIQQ